MLPMLRSASEVTRAVQRGDADGLERREARLDQQFDLALIGVAGDDAASPGRIGAGDEHAAGAGKRALERHRLGKQPGIQQRIRPLSCLRHPRVGLLELLLQLRRQHVEPRRHRTARREGLEHGERRGQRDALVDQLLDQRA